MPTLLLLLALCPPQQAVPDRYTTLAKRGITLEYTDLSPRDAEAYLENLLTARLVLERAVGLELPFQPKFRVRLRPDGQRAYWTDGLENVTVQYVNAGLVAPVLPDDGRILDIAIDAYVQIYLLRSVTSMAGIDPRIHESFSGYLRHLAKLSNPGIQAITEPEGLALIWYQIDELYGSGTTSFTLNSLHSVRVPGHELGAKIREIVLLATEDERVGDLLDEICLPEPVYGAMNLEPSAPLATTTTIRLSRGCLFNGARLADQGGPEIDVATRLADFEKIYSNLIRTYPDRSLQEMPPTIHGVKLWDMYFEFRPRIERAAHNLDFYLVLREFLSRFDDQSLAVASMHGAAVWKGVPGLSVEADGDRIVVHSVTPDGIADKAGVKSGMELIRVDGRPTLRVWRLLEHFLASTASCGSKALAKARAMNVLLTGAEGSTAQLEFRSGESTIQAEIPRVNPAPSASTSVQFTDLKWPEPGVALLKVRLFFGPDMISQFMRAIDEVNEKHRQLPKEGGENTRRGLVIDLRDNEGGDPKLAFTCLTRMLVDKLTVCIIQNRDEAEREGHVNSRPIVVGIPKKEIKDPRMMPYEGPLVVLVNSWTGGCSELFALGVQQAARGRVVGHSTPGLVNQPNQPIQPWQTLVGTGVTVSFTQFQISKVDGSTLQSVGVTPDVVVGARSEDLSAGKDSMLERALSLLSN